MMNMSSVKEKLTSSGQGGDAKKSTNSVEPLNSPKKSAEANMTVPTDALDAERGLGSARQQHQDDGQGNQMQPEEPFSVFTKAQRRFVIFTAALTTLLPPLTASIYYPVITMLARDLNVSLTDINLTITTYLIVQGIAPSLVGNLSDETGRRPALLISLLIYIAGCVGAAVKANYAVLFVMRCLQSAGSSGTIALSLATVSDIVTSAERGRHTSNVQLGYMLGPSLGPVIGGLLSQHLGWRSIFWFLAIYASTVWIFCAAFLPETSRDLVGNGSIPPGKWNMTLTSYLQRGRRSPVQIGERSAAELSLCPEEAKSAATRSKTRHVNPLNSLKLFGEEETGILLLYSGLIYANSYMVLSTLPDELEKGYGLDTLHISLCFLASGFGSVASATFTGRLLDWNFRRHARLVGMEISNQKQQDLSRFPIELARLQISVPALILAGASLVAYSWTLQARIHLSVPLILLFLQSFGSTSAFSGFSNLIMDLNRKKPGTASAAMNLSRCWMGAGGTVFATPLVTAAGIGWLGVTIAGLWFLFSPLVLLVLRYGPRWRDEKRLREEEAVPNNSLPASGARTT